MQAALLNYDRNSCNETKELFSRKKNFIVYNKWTFNSPNILININ